MQIPESLPAVRKAPAERVVVDNESGPPLPLDSRVTQQEPAPLTSNPPAPLVTVPPLSMGSALEGLATSMLPPVRRKDLSEIDERDRPLAQAINQHPLLGDPDLNTLSSEEVRRTWKMADRLGVDRESLGRLSALLGVEPEEQQYERAIERVFGSARPTRHTRIISTIGPKSANVETLTAMIRNGTDVARLNFSHIESFEQAQALVDTVRAAMKAAGRTIAIMGDLPGPKIRVGDLAAPLEAPVGKTFTLGKDLPVNPPQIVADMKLGDRIYIDDGEIALRVTGKDTAQVVGAPRNATIRPRKGLNLPDTRLTERIPTDRDLQRLGWMKRLGVHLIAASYVEDADDVRRVRSAYESMPGEGPPPLIVAKVERPQALQNLPAIYQVCDAVMVARGDLAVEIGEEHVPVVQQRLHRMGHATCLPTGTATQMLESMTTDPRPKRAEVSDVARAVLEGAAFVMTSEETAVGVDPAHVVDTMARIVEAMESALRDGSALSEI